ncbi:MAG: DinB family protein [Rhodanobacter sp.]
MTANAHIQLLMRYRSWANALMFDALSGLPGAVLTEPQPIVFGSIIRTLNHVRAMDAVWQAHLLGQPHGMTTRNPAECPPLATLREAQRSIDAWFVDYADGLADAQQQEQIRFRFIGGGESTMTRALILLHVANHATYHRGHVADMMYRAGAVPPTTDLPVFLATHS